MPFNGSGTFTIVNTFVPNTTILSAAVNQNFTDIATGLSDCLTRDGQAGMTAALKAVSGSVSAPGITFNADATAGLYLASSGIVGLVAKSLGLLVNSATLQAASATIAAGGSGYAVGDTITLTGGTAINQPVFTVATLSGTAVATVSLSYPGNYSVTPSNPVSQSSTSGIGTGATFTVLYATQFTESIVTDESGNVPWVRLGSSSFVSGLMAKVNGLDFATAVGGANIAAAIGSSFILPPAGRLSLISNTAVVNTDTSAATSLFWVPYKGNGTPIFNGTSFVNVLSNSQLTLAATSGAQALSGIYDVYKFLNSGTPTLGFSPSWSAGTSGSVTLGSCARGTGTGGTALTLIDGIWVNTVSMTMNNGATTFTVPANQGTYLGTVRISTTAGQMNCLISFGQSRSWDVWNAYNGVPIVMNAGDSTSSWTNAPTSWGPSNTNSANNLIVLAGLAEQWIKLRFEQIAASAEGASTSDAQIAIGLNSTSSLTGRQGEQLLTEVNNGTIRTTLSAVLLLSPRIGANQATCLNQSANGATNNTYFGTSGFMGLVAEYIG